jgi:sigma-E factor negative regulatory protein RseA
MPAISTSSPEWLSSFMDAEAADEGDRLPDFLTSSEGLARWDAYHLIGDVLRTPDLAHPVSAGFHARFLAALEQETPIIAAPRRNPQRRFMTRYGLPGLAAAAAVASVTWMAQPYFGSQPGLGNDFSATMAFAGPRDGQVSQVSAPVAPAAAPVLTNDNTPADMSLAEYLDAHRQISGRSPMRQVSNTSYESEAGQR